MATFAAHSAAVGGWRTNSIVSEFLQHRNYTDAQSWIALIPVNSQKSTNAG